MPLIARLQRQAGNTAVASLLSRLPPGSESAAILRGSQISDGGAIHALQRAAVDERGPEGVVEDLREAVKLLKPVHLVAVNFDAAAAVLADLTPSQGKQVEDLWLRKVDHPLRPLLAGVEDDFQNTNLRPDQFKALANLLRGTRADVSEGFMAPAKAWVHQAEAEEHRLVVQAAKLHDGLRQGESGKEAAFAALAATGGGPEQTDKLEQIYVRHYRTSTMIDLTVHLSGLDLQRAIALFTGDHAGAEAIAIEGNLEVKRRSEQDSHTVLGMARAQAQQKKADAAIEEHLANLRASGGSETVKKALGRKSGDSTIGAKLDALKQDDSASVRKALTENDESRLIAARLARLQNQGKLTAGEIETELKNLRDAVRSQVIAELLHRTGSAPAEEQRRLLMNRLPMAFMELETLFTIETKQSFRHVITITGSDGPRVAGMGNIELPPGAEQERNLELLRGFGTFVDEDRTVFGIKVGHISAAVKELDVAVREKDVKRIRRALADRTKTQVDKLADEYKSQTGRDLHSDLLGSPEMEAVYRVLPGFDREARAEKSELLEGDKFEPSDPWNLDAKRLLVEEASWIHHRIDGLYKRVIENRGLFAEARDWVGNLERTLVDDARNDAEGAYSALFNDQRISRMQPQLSILKRCQARLEHNVDRYKEATREAFDTFVEIAVFAVTTALTLGEGGAAILALRSMMGTVGTKLVLKGDDYSLAEFRNDILGGAAGALGGHAASKAFEELMPSLTAAAAKEASMTVPGHIASFAKESSKFYANQLATTNAAALATGQQGSWVGISDLAQGVLGHVAGTTYKGIKRGGSSAGGTRGPETESVPSAPKPDAAAGVTAGAAEQSPSTSAGPVRLTTPSAPTISTGEAPAPKAPRKGPVDASPPPTVVPLEPQRVLALGRYERPFPGDRVLPVQDALLEEASAATGGQLRPMLLGGMASFRDVWFPLAQTEPSHLASGTLVQEALEGHNNIQAIYFNTTGTELLHAGHTSAEYRSVLVAAAAGTHKVDIFIEHEGGLSVIRAGADHLEGAPLPAELVRHLPPSFDTAAKAAPVAGTGTATAPGLTTTPIDLQRKFKHASDFGIVGNYNPTSAKLFDAAVKAHVESPGVQEINGSYRGNPARIFVDPKTRLAVITKPSGEFVSGWRLTPEQLQYVLNKRKLGGS